MRVDLKNFEDAYRLDPDPWGFETSPYEIQKYETTLAHLQGRRFRRCFEPGCSNGALTTRLATIADCVVSYDASPTAIETAKASLSSKPNVELAVATLPEQWPSGTFDLIVLSELGYYWDERGLRSILENVGASLSDDGVLIAVHWLGTSADHLLNGEDVHRIMQSHFGTPTIHLRAADNRLGTANAFVLDRWDTRDHN